MVEDAGGVFATMGDAVLQAADETERLGTIELAKANPQTQMLARWLKTQHFMQRWLGMSFGVTYGADYMQFYALVNELIEDWIGLDGTNGTFCQSSRRSTQRASKRCDCYTWTNIRRCYATNII